MQTFWHELKQSSRNVVQLAVPVIFVEEVASALFPWTFSSHKDAEFVVWLLLATWFDARFRPFRHGEECACKKVSRHRWDICRCVLLWLLFLLWVPARSCLLSDYRSKGSAGAYVKQGFLLVVPVVFFCGTVYWSRRLAMDNKSYSVSFHPDSSRHMTRSMSRANTSASSVWSRSSAHWSNDTLFSWTSLTRLTASESSVNGFTDDTDGFADNDADYKDTSERGPGRRGDWAVSSDEEQPTGPPVKPRKQPSLSSRKSKPMPAVVLRSRTRMDSSDN